MSAPENTSLIKAESQAIELQQQPGTLLSLILQVAKDPTVDVNKLRELLAMQERMEDRAAKSEFSAAMSRLQARIPQIGKGGAIIVKDKLQSQYAKLEDIDVVLRPLMDAEGFSFSFAEVSVDQHGRKFCARVTHRAGHFEEKFLTLALDTSGNKNSTQASGSTVSYAQRYLMKMHFNIVERNVDNDGGDEEFITKEQALDIETAIADTNSKLDNFLRLIAGAPSIAEIPARDYKRVMSALAEKKRGMEGK